MKKRIKALPLRPISKPAACDFPCDCPPDCC